VLHLDVRQIPESGEDYHQVGRGEGFETWDVVVAVGIDRAIRRVDGEQHGAAEAVPRRKDLGELRQGLFGAVLLVAADEHDVPSLAGTFASLEDDTGRVDRDGSSEQRRKKARFDAHSVLPSSETEMLSLRRR
jgi:hypothetical protein